MDTITIEMPSYIYKHMQLLVEDKAVSAFLKYIAPSYRDVASDNIYIYKYNEFLPIMSLTSLGHLQHRVLAMS